MNSDLYKVCPKDSMSKVKVDKIIKAEKDKQSAIDCKYIETKADGERRAKIKESEQQ